MGALMEADKNLGTLCFYPARAMEAHLSESMVAAGYNDITPAQNRVFQRVTEDGVRIGQLARQTMVTKQTATFIVDQLERSDYVERVPDPTDARARLVRLSGRGKDLVQVANKASQQIESSWTDHLGEDEADSLRHLLTKLRQVTDPTCA